MVSLSISYSDTILQLGETLKIELFASFVQLDVVFMLRW